ncbi:MAG: hypothetical protein AAGE86_15185, partial [Pseudomonadota bacterium]
GNLVKSVESHDIVPQGDNACTVKITVQATFVDGLSDREIANEVALMGMSVHNDLYKLAMLAEEGLDAVKDYEAENF